MLNLGTRVITINGRGTICNIQGTSIGVNHDKSSPSLHTCNSFCKEYHGWYYMKKDLQPVDARDWLDYKLKKSKEETS